MELLKAYREIEKRLEKIDFPALLRGFHRFPFALYDDTQAYLDGEYLEKPAEFLANTSVVFRGQHTAIWKITDDTPDPDTLTSKIVHEMLHAYQNASGETRWADERAALVNYRYDDINLSARLEEARLMRACLSENAPQAFSRLLSVRKARFQRFSYAYDYEARIEQIEGTAHFVELAALAQLDPAKAQARWAQLLDALDDPAGYFPVRTVTYLSGAAFLSCLHKYTQLDTDGFTDIPYAIAALRYAQPCGLPESDARAGACLARWQEKTGARIAETLEKGDLVLDGEYRLFAWNVYDAVWDGKYAVLSSFIGYVEGEMPKTDEELFSRMKILNGDFVGELGKDFRLYRLWRQ